MRRLLYLISCLFIMASCATAQNYPTKEIAGKSYYIHTVAPGNTLYAISKQYAVEVKDITEANPEAKQGLSIGQQLKIPVDRVNKKQARKEDVRAEGEYLIHTVQKKETLFSISKLYKVAINDIVEENAGTDKELPIGYSLKIPVQKITSAKIENITPAAVDSFMVHEVKSGETAYSLSKMYNIPLDSLNEANNNFPEGMRVGNYIRIPKYNNEYLEKLRMIAEAADTLRGDENKFLSGSKDTYNIALMLPFSLEMNDSLESKMASGEELLLLTEIALDFYRGARIALDSLKKSGLNANIYVYDIGEDVVDARNILKKPEMANINMIIGPMHKAPLAVVSEFSKKNKIYLVSPNAFTNDIFGENPYLMRVKATPQTQLRYLSNFIAINHQNDNVIMMNSRRTADDPYRRLFRSSYDKAIDSYPNSIRDTLMESGMDKYNLEGLIAKLKKDRKNILVVPSNELAFVSDFMTRLSRINDSDYDIQIYGLDDWLEFNNIEAEYKNRFKLRILAAAYVDYDNFQLQKFLKEYRERHNMEPNKYHYGFMAFDLTYFFVGAMLEKGLSFPLEFNDMHYQGIQSAFHMGASPAGKEFENKNVYILEYDDYNIKRVN